MANVDGKVGLNDQVARLVAACCRRWQLTLLAGLVLGVAAAFHVATHFTIDTDAVKLLSPQLAWRQREIAFDKLYPQKVQQTAIVVDGVTPELAERGARLLADALRKRTDVVRNVFRPDGGPYFDREGLMLLPTEEVQSTMQSLIQAQPLLGPLAADPSARGLLDTLATYLQGVSYGQAKLEDLQRPFDALSGTVEAASQGKVVPLNWRGLVTGQPPNPMELRRFILVQPVLDFNDLQPGSMASDAIRATAKDLGLTPENGIRVRLTGEVPMADEEFGTLGEGAAFNGALTVIAVLVLLWLAVKSFRMVGAILGTVVIGLAVSAAFGLIATGPFNLLSIAFIVLFVGLGVDFGIQFSVRYRADRLAHDGLAEALTAAGRGVGRGLTIAAAATAAGFLAFLPTDYRGVSQLGIIAGVGMGVAFLLSVTFLPALLMLLRPKGEQVEVGYQALAPLDRLILTRRRWVLASAALVAVACATLLPRLSFDFNPLNLRSPKTEAVSVVLELMKDPLFTPNTIDVLANSEDEARALAEKLSKLPEVAQAITLSDYIPTDQDAKMAAISDAALLLGPTLSPPDVRPAPSIEDVRQSMTAIVAALDKLAPDGATPAGASALRFRKALEGALAAPAEKVVPAFQRATEPGLQTMLAQVNDSLQAAPVTIKDLPEDLRRDWVAADGHARISVFPKGDSNDNQVLKRFVKAVRAVAPDATGTPISIQESSATIIHAFLQAGILALVLVTILLAITLRNVGDVLKTLAPLALAALLTLAAAILAGKPINFANIIALPLLFGIGTAFNIYYVMAWRQGQANPLTSSLTRATILSALTTGTAFGSLWTSHHPGTASMGELLVFSLASILITALLFLPALLGPPKTAAE
ncbi:MMPL family transporter [Nitrospirillum iridis]|uniref:SSD domain-containing protein n=1 Tax=Nitrospirillum iridis TaxID=765888 RepID=A0A7X0EDG5_9PROT|nr:MMPL family transporter [Nitrospirillum iridis]MBB6252747.1 hypothetical protein [Nitrospirillum iridis]